jgi:hypothetical protein
MFEMSQEQQSCMDRDLLIQNAVIGQKVFRVEPVGQCEISYGPYWDFAEEGVKEEGVIDM